MSDRTLENVIGDRYWVMTEEDVKCLRDAQAELTRLRGIETAVLGGGVDRVTSEKVWRDWGESWDYPQCIAIADALEAKP